MSSRSEVDTLVVGGGVVGMAIAYGLAGAGERVRVLDEGDDAFRAARGNFGLVWVQGKGLGCPDYARWSMNAAQQWPSFSRELQELTGIDVEYVRNGGITLCLDQDDLDRRIADLERIKSSVGGQYPYEVLEPRDLRKLEPFAGPEVAGALFCPVSGHASPLRLLRALVSGFTLRRGQIVAGARCERIVHRSGQFHVRAKDGEHVASRVVLAAGLGNRELAPMVGLRAPVTPNRGQILVTERLQPFMHHATVQVRQTGEGVVQIGDSKEDVGFDDGTTVAQLSRIAHRAARMFPLLRDVNVVRTWGALRVMTGDGFPIYQASRECPGAFVATCHSGITLASMHAGAITRWLRGEAEPNEIRSFKAERFDAVQAH